MRYSFNARRTCHLSCPLTCLTNDQVVCTERRRKKPYNARWLQGFKQGEYFLQTFDPSSRFWKQINIQLGSLRISQCVIIGRGIILAQPMMPLPSPATMDPMQESKRFDWLLYGTKQEMYEIHGGCGFSKRLLHLISQITFLSTRLQQEQESMVLPMTAEYLYRELSDMRQWSSESRGWEDVRAGIQTISGFARCMTATSSKQNMK